MECSPPSACTCCRRQGELAGWMHSFRALTRTWWCRSEGQWWPVPWARVLSSRWLRYTLVREPSVSVWARKWTFPPSYCRSSLLYSINGCIHHHAVFGVERVQTTADREKSICTQTHTYSKADHELIPYCKSSELLCSAVEKPLPPCITTWHLVLQANYKYLHEQLSAVAEKHGERVLHTPNNPISIGELSI